MGCPFIVTTLRVVGEKKDQWQREHMNQRDRLAVLIFCTLDRVSFAFKPWVCSGLVARKTPRTRGKQTTKAQTGNSKESFQKQLWCAPPSLAAQASPCLAPGSCCAVCPSLTVGEHLLCFDFWALKYVQTYTHPRLNFHGASFSRFFFQDFPPCLLASLSYTFLQYALPLQPIFFFRAVIPT